MILIPLFAILSILGQIREIPLFWNPLFEITTVVEIEKQNKKTFPQAKTIC